MRIILAESAGFCMGVRRALDAVMNEFQVKKRNIYTHGPLIHNPQVIDFLGQNGINPLSGLKDCEPGSTIVIRAHGVPLSVKYEIKKAGFKLLDATCPKVTMVQQLVVNFSEKNYATIIVGELDHPEVTGIVGYAKGPVEVVALPEQIKNMPCFDKVLLISQTTQNEVVFNAVKDEVIKRWPDARIKNTICDSTYRRQNDVRKLSKEAEAIIIVGGRNSGNTRRLVDIAFELNHTVFHVERSDELNPCDFENIKTVGISAGASTPNWVISEVIKRLKEFNGC